MWPRDLLAGRVALVTGASRGIGRSAALRLAEAGASVWLNAKTEGSLDGVYEQLDAAGLAGARKTYFDVSDAQQVAAAFREVQKSSGRLDILVNNAGILKEAAFEMSSPAMMDEVWAVNMRGALLCSQYASRLMTRSGGGSIINIASIMGRVGRAGQVVYSATKAGLIGATLSLGKELGAKNIRVNAIAPGVIETDLIGHLDPGQRSDLQRRVSLGRLGTPDDVAGLCVFLASDAAAYITGQVIGVDGGLVA
jgi:3-oxoacyl-[acyl-carrier protein] reductase